MKPNQLWFLWMLFWIFVLIWPLYRLIKNNDLVLITVISVSYILGAVGQQFLPNLFCIWTALTYMPSFLIGLYMRIKEESDDKSVIMQIPWWVWFFIHMLLFVLYKMVIGDHDSLLFLPIKLVSHFLLNAVGAIMGFMTLNRLGQALNWKNSKNFLRLAKLSMPIYLFHQQIIYIVIYLLNGKANPYINALANYIACFTISIAISSILIRYKATRFLVGEK